MGNTLLEYLQKVENMEYKDKMLQEILKQQLKDPERPIAIYMSYEQLSHFGDSVDVQKDYLEDKGGKLFFPDNFHGACVVFPPMFKIGDIEYK